MKTKIDLQDAIVPNDQYWGVAEVLRTQQTDDSYLYWYERHLVETAAQHLAAAGVSIQRIHVIACGPGRELRALQQAFPNAHIIASDLTPEAVEACRANLQRWNCATNIEVKCCSADELTPAEGLADLVITFGSMLTYIAPAAARQQMLQKLRALLHPHGILMGTVHHRWGRWPKFGYFALQQMAHAVGLSAQEPGDYYGRFAGMRTLQHFFSADELRRLLQSSGFTPQEIHSLATLGSKIGHNYRATSGDNNLVFLSRPAASVS